jgi:hypothetical protein
LAPSAREYADLVLIAERWAGLPPAIREAIVAMVKAASGA